MAGVKAAFLNEVDKLLKKKKVLAAIVLSIIAVVVGQIAVTAIKGGFGLRIVGSSEFPIAVLSVLIYTILPVFTAFAAIEMFSGEFSANTMKITLARPVSRIGVFTAKVLGIAVFILMNLIFVMVFTTLTGFLFNGAAMNMRGFIRIILSYGVSFLPIFVFSLFVVLLANIFKGGPSAFLVSVIVFIGLNFLGIIFSRYSSFFITSMFDWFTLWISDRPNMFKILRLFLIMTGCGTMLFAAGYYLFEKRDL